MKKIIATVAKDIKGNITILNINDRAAKDFLNLFDNFEDGLKLKSTITEPKKINLIFKHEIMDNDLGIEHDEWLEEI